MYQLQNHQLKKFLRYETLKIVKNSILYKIIVKNFYIFFWFPIIINNYMGIENKSPLKFIERPMKIPPKKYC